VLSTIISRIRGTSHAVPLIAAYDDHERLWLPPAPVLFQRRIGAENRAIPAATIRKILTAALARTGLTGPAGNPLHYTPHDFRRMFLTDAKMSRVASDASFPGKREDGAARDSGPCLPTAACSA
jgi:integrase